MKRLVPMVVLFAMIGCSTAPPPPAEKPLPPKRIPDSAKEPSAGQADKKPG